MAQVASRPPSRSGRTPGTKEKESICQRMNRLEENMMRNLQVMREHRHATHHIQEARKEEAARTLQGIRDACKLDLGDLLGAGGPAEDPPPPPELRKGSMKDRCLAIEEHLNQAGTTLREHRTFLDSARAKRREQGQEARADATLAQEEGQSPAPSAPPAANHHVVAENARWMGSALQAAAKSKAQAEARAALVGGPAPTPRATRPASAGPATRPLAVLMPRPTSAAAAAATASRSATPRSALSSWRGSRPSSGSMKARCNALTENLQQNKEKMREHRRDLELVVKLRKEKEEKMAEEMARGLREVFAFVSTESSG